MSFRRRGLASAASLVLLSAAIAARAHAPSSGRRPSELWDDAGRPRGASSSSAPWAEQRVWEGASRRAPAVALHRSVFGWSGALRVREVVAGEHFALPLAWRARPLAPVSYRWRPVWGTPGLPGPWQPFGAGGTVGGPLRPGVYVMEIRTGAEERALPGLRLIVQVPWERARRGFVGTYSIGSYPASLGRRGYRAPAGFIEVTPENEDVPLSEHLRLRQFLTHDQGAAWPKYAVVDPRLLDKLELVLAELERMGVPARRLHVMSGYRTPQYNRRGLGAGRAVLSRHQFGDAADVWVDNDGDGYMDDLNRDGRRDVKDATVMLRAVERVERRHPELVGGAGTYRATRAHGPFIHIDARGKRARWGGVSSG